MCGIAGILATETALRPTPQELRRCIAAMRHRGPDGFGLYVDDHCGLAQARLSIIDLATGWQPMSNEDGSLWVAFNGEIFNYVELRPELERHGHVFRTRSDTEAIVHAYEQWGDDAWGRFNGQFAVALWDARTRQLTLARDRVGIAPLFYAIRANAGGTCVAFASEMKAIFATGRVSPSLDPKGIARTFTLWSNPAPWTSFEHVHAVEPGSLVRFDVSRGDLREHKAPFWRAKFEPGSARVSLDEAAEELESRLRRAVSIRLRADVPVGAYLSGGLDSSVITRLIDQAGSSKLQTFSLRFADARFDEGSAQMRMAELLGTDHHEVVCGPREIADALPDVVWHAETPLLRTGPAPMFLLSALVRRHGMKVVLTGEGSDEFLGGYDIFKEDRIRRFWARRPDSAMRPALLARVHPYVAAASQGGAQGAGKASGQLGGMWHEFFRRSLRGTEDPFYAHRPRWDNTAWSLRFLSPIARGAFGPGDLDRELLGVLPAEFAGLTALERAQAAEITTFMSSYLLSSQGDRMILGNAVEGRFPFLDPECIDFACRLPTDLKLCGLRDKVALRHLASKHLPREIWQRRKWPYRAPIAGALFGNSAPDWVRDALSPRALASNPMLDATPASNLAKRGLTGDGPTGEREEMALVGILTMQLLRHAFEHDLRRRIDAQMPGVDNHTPDVFVDRRTGALGATRA